MDVNALRQVMGGNANYEALVGPMNEAMIAAGATNQRRAAMWCAQVGHESAGLRYMEEIADGSAYEGRSDLGNYYAGDGRRFKGRGPIQLTGRANYRAFTNWARSKGISDIDFEANPQLLSEPKWGFLAASYYWVFARPDINQLADAGDLVTVTRRINGGTNGLDDRRERYSRALAMGNRILPTQGGQEAIEKVLDYPRDQVAQDTGYYCGPATVQTIVRAASGKFIPEFLIADRLGTTTNGTNYIGSLATVINQEIGGKYATVNIPGNDATQAQREALWEHLVRSISAGKGVAANIIAPPSNYPRPAYTSRDSLKYSGGTVYHYVALMGVAQDAGGRYVWWADSGFSPYGCWITLEQTASLIAGKGYAWPSDSPQAQLQKEGFLMALSEQEQRELLEKTRAVHHELTHRFDSRYDLARLNKGEITPEQVHKETLAGYILDNDRKIEDVHANMLPAIWLGIKNILTGKKDK